MTMDANRSIVSGFGLLMALILVGCQTDALASPGVIVTTDGREVERLKPLLAKALGRGTIEIGPFEMGVSTSISVLPPRTGPLEGRSLNQPIIFDIVIKERVCYLQRRDTGELIRADRLVCVLK